MRRQAAGGTIFGYTLAHVFSITGSHDMATIRQKEST